jgi:hypothetical protein
MQDLGYELPRIPIPRTSVNKGKKKGPERESSDPSSSCALCSLLRACFAKLRVEKKLYALRYEKDLSYRSL